MFKISNLLNRLKEPVVLAPDGVVFSGNVENNVVKASKNWYEEIADKIKVQRNLLLVLPYFHASKNTLKNKKLTCKGGVVMLNLFIIKKFLLFFCSYKLVFL